MNAPTPPARSATGLSPGASPSPAPPSGTGRWRDRRLIGWYVGVCLVLGLFVAAYVGREHTIYFWDLSNYQGRFREFGALVRTDPARAARALILTTRYEDYNFVAVAPLMPFYLLFGGGRLSFVMAVTVMYALPAVVLFSLLIRELVKRLPEARGREDFGWIAIPTLLIGLLPEFWSPVLRGFPDVGGVGVVIAVLAIYGSRPPAAQTLPRLALIGVMLTAIVLFRRWWAFWAVGFGAAVAAHAVWQVARTRRLDDRGFLMTVRAAAVIGLAATGSLLALARPLAVEMVTTDYGQIHAGFYTSETPLQQASTLVGHFGVVTAGIAAVGLVVGLTRREWRGVTAFLFVQLAVTYALFRRTQDFYIHHYALLIPGLLVFAALALLTAYMRLRTRAAGIAFTTAVMAVGAANFWAVLDPLARVPPWRVSYVADGAGRAYFPIRRTDLGEVHRLLGSLDSLHTSSGGSIYVLASSWMFNNKLLVEAARSFDPPFPRLEAESGILWTHHIDSRDGFPNRFFKAEFAVVGDPVRYHRAPEAQRVIGVLAGQMLAGSGIGKAYDRLPLDFTFQDGSKAHVYRRTRHFDPAALRAMADTFAALYPGRRDAFAVRLPPGVPP